MYLLEDKKLPFIVAFLTFFFGFGAGAALNLYLLHTHNPLVTQFRGTLTFKSAILGDGVILPIVNAICITFLRDYRKYITHTMLLLTAFIAVGITLYFHIAQATRGLTNWAMPTPWHWNFIGLWHLLYMVTVIGLLSLFYIVAVRVTRTATLPAQLIFVTLAIGVFLGMLAFDYNAL